MTSLQVNCLHGMVMIKSNFLDYSNIRSMYKTGNGCGIQTEHYINEVKAFDICNKIADLCYQLEDVQKTGYDDKVEDMIPITGYGKNPFEDIKNPEDILKINKNPGRKTD